MKKTIGAIYFIIFLTSFSFSDTTVVAFNSVHQSFGSLGNYRVVTDTISFPESNQQYAEIIMTVMLECPGGGCDPWDRKANIKVEHLNNWFEIGRYVTPYGIGCSWSFDVTDYRSLLEGDVSLRSFIDTWVQPGWLVTISFDFISGVPENPFTVVRNIWNYDYVVYGDTTNPVDITPETEYLPMDVTEVNLRMITTGHGQGNTENAAEFSLKLHDIYMNNELAYVHNFWRDDCEYNQCSPQYGTWQYDRAGFCPGDKVHHQDFYVMNFVSAGDTVRLEYVLEDYFNQCSPNNPSCVDGITCSECSYNNSGHTEPNYFIESQLIMHTESYHTNADTYLSFVEISGSSPTVDIYMENYVPVYGIQFNILIDLLDGIEIGELIFQNGQGGRAEDSGWTIGVNDSGLVVGLAQGTAEPIPPGEGLLTQIPWNGNIQSNLSGTIHFSDVQISGYFGTELSLELGEPVNIELGLGVNEDITLPLKHKLLNAYPNPFNSIVTIPFQLISSQMVFLKIFDLNGKEIITLVDNDMAAGRHYLKWDAGNQSSGVYFSVLEIGKYIDTKKLIILK